MKRRINPGTWAIRIHGVALGAMLGGCAAVGPDYAPPQPQTPPTWTSTLESGLSDKSTDQATLAAWWKTLNDPLLSDLIDRAAASNLDLESAKSRVREARARRGLSEADRFPTIGFSGDGSSSRSDPDSGATITRDLFSAQFDARWELDIFGGKQRAVEAADAQLQSSEENLRDVMVSLLAEVALNYIDVRSFQARLAIARRNLSAQQESFEIVRWRARAGLTTELDVEQAKFSLEQTRAQLPALQLGLAQAGNRLAVLLGQPPGALNGELATPSPIPVTPMEMAVGVPADMLRRRPDVRRAERELAAQTAQVGVAAAARYPSFSLFGAIGMEASSIDNLFSAATQASSIGANIAATIFDAGRLRQNVEIQTALQEQAFIAYQATVLTALQDAENALVAYVQEQDRRASLIEAARAANHAAELAGNQYESGLVDFQVVLIAQRSALSLEDQLASSESEITSNLVRLYKSLGGGWNSLEASATKGRL